ncbi:hypothetical protein AGLY_004230 [Aphis glycines]|uniref:Uncharacterized protein n=1 Tax=Aphis glycines TaxID=307491 RepID=A0A6G0TXM4_APHGL|nr:hypothetical protein AGLY_004230 [Aphis glycines]
MVSGVGSSHQTKHIWPFSTREHIQISSLRPLDEPLFQIDFKNIQPAFNKHFKSIQPAFKEHSTSISRNNCPHSISQEPSETGETQKSFKKGTNLENETEKMKQLIHLQQNLQKNFKKSDLEHSEKKLNVIDEDEDEDEGDNNNASPIQGNIEYTPKKIQKIINLKNNLQNNYRKTVLNDKYTAEEKVKHYEPILKALSNVESSVNDVKEVAIKTDNDIQKMIIPPCKPKNPEL